MADKPASPDGKPVPTDAPATTPVPPKRGPGHRGADVKDTVAEMAAKAHEISLEAGSKMAAAMKDVINAAAGITGFVVESARDLVQYMVRRGQMTQEEADKLIRQAEEAHASRPATARTTAPATPARPAKESAPSSQEQSSDGEEPKEAGAAEKKGEAEKKPAAKKAAAKTAAADKPAEKKAAAKSPAATKKATTKKK